jgi:hypothetical protein
LRVGLIIMSRTQVYSFSFQVRNNGQGQYAPDISMHLFRKRLFSWTFVMERYRYLHPTPLHPTLLHFYTLCS